MERDGFTRWLRLRAREAFGCSVSRPDHCEACGEGPVEKLGPIVLTLDGYQHYRCIPTFVRKDELAASRYIVDLDQLGGVAHV
jgi:hypothetical protein